MFRKVMTAPLKTKDDNQGSGRWSTSLRKLGPLGRHANDDGLSHIPLTYHHHHLDLTALTLPPPFTIP